MVAVVAAVVVVQYYCFLMITIIVGTPILPDSVWPLKYTPFSTCNTNVAPV